jgi:hypothetical protein
MDLKEIGLGDMAWIQDWIGTGYEPMAGSCEHANEHSGSVKFWEIP